VQQYIKILMNHLFYTTKNISHELIPENETWLEAKSTNIQEN